MWHRLLANGFIRSLRLHSKAAMLGGCRSATSRAYLRALARMYRHADTADSSALSRSAGEERFWRSKQGSTYPLFFSKRRDHSTDMHVSRSVIKYIADFVEWFFDRSKGCCTAESQSNYIYRKSSWLLASPRYTMTVAQEMHQTRSNAAEHS